MKKLYLASIILTISISLVGCTNSGTASNGNQNNTESSTQNNVNNTVDISLDKAKEIALSHAGLTSSQVTFKRTELDFDNGIQKYDIEFCYDGKEYDYEINANNGEIIKYDYDMENNYTPNNNTTNSQSNVNTTANISLDKAKEIALSHAGLTSSQVTFKRTELDFDNGIQKYEVEFYYNNREYSYEIDANTGNVLSYEQD